MNLKRKFFSLLLLGMGGLTVSAQLLPYQNPELTADERASDLLTRLTLDQKVSLMVNESAAIPELGIKRYDWWSEALHGYARSGLATVFPQAIGMAASFDPALVQDVFTAVSDEARAKNHAFAAGGDGVGRYQGLTVWTPNINIFRDPRWGRGQETYGEDPFLTAEMGLSVVRGLQGPADSKYDKLHACAKHYAVHSGPEWSRHSFNVEDISLRDLTETYLYAFERLVREGNVKEVMCAYNAVEGQPCCTSNTLLTQILRNQWGYDNVVVSDCGAIDDFYAKSYENHRTHPDAASASADAVINGTDLNCGNTYRHITEAVERGLITEEQVDRSVFRLLRARFQLGEMDPDSLVEWTRIPYDVVASKEHDALALKMAHESIVLLQNSNKTLPLDVAAYTPAHRLAVIGPNADDSLAHWGNYYGTAARTYSVLTGIRGKVADPEAVVYHKVSELVSPETFISHFADCSSGDAGSGMLAQYYAGTERAARPIATAVYTSPFQLCTSGGTVFAPGVPLTGFSATYTTVYHAKADGELIVSLFANGQGSITVADGEPVTYSMWHGSRRVSCTTSVEAGHDYPIQILFAPTNGDAQLNVDLGMSQPLTDDALLTLLDGIDDVVYVGGISPQLEGEEMRVDYEGFRGGDRTSIELPAVQRHALQVLHEAGKRIIYVNMSGSAIALEPETVSCDAIVQGWYGGQDGGLAIADVLFGDCNPGGRLPVTFYRNDSQLPPYEDYHMSSGHTYRYLKEKPLFAFGYGLSYSRFRYGHARRSRWTTACADITFKACRALKGSVTLTVPVTNVSRRDGDEVVQLYVARVGDTEGPARSLRAFRRVTIPAGQKARVTFTLTDRELATFDADAGALVTTPGRYRIYYGPSSDPKALRHVDVRVR